MRDDRMSRIIKPGDRAFYINRRRYVETEGMARIGLEGIYTIRAIKAGGRVVRELSFKNLLTDIGLDAIGGGANFTRMHLGTGTSTPSVHDTALGNFGVNVQSSNPSSTHGVNDAPPYYGYARLTWTSTVGGATGTWTEIGISNQNTNGNLRSRALILDGGGNPTSFPVLADEQFQGTYEFRLYPPTADANNAVNLSGVPYNTTTRALMVTTSHTNGGWNPSNLTSNNSLFNITTSIGFNLAYTGGLAAVTASVPEGNALTSNNRTIGNNAYGPGNYYFDVWVRHGAGDAVGLIRTQRLNTAGGSFQIEYDPVISKTTTEEFIHNQRISWARR